MSYRPTPHVWRPAVRADTYGLSCDRIQSSHHPRLSLRCIVARATQLAWVWKAEPDFLPEPRELPLAGAGGAIEVNSNTAGPQSGDIVRVM